MDTSAARAAILARIRSAQRRADGAYEAERAQALDYLARHPRGPQPAPLADICATFVAQAERMGSTIETISDRADGPQACARYLDAWALPRRVVCWPALQDLDWAAAGLDARMGSIADGDLVGISGTCCAVAETGTIVMLSGPQTPARTHLLPETHIAFVDRHRILATMEDAFDLIRRETSGLPRAVNFVSGPSRTGDIEQTIVLGAHGPYRVHVVVVGG